MRTCCSGRYFARKVLGNDAGEEMAEQLFRPRFWANSEPAINIFMRLKGIVASRQNRGSFDRESMRRVSRVVKIRITRGDNVHEQAWNFAIFRGRHFALVFFQKKMGSEIRRDCAIRRWGLCMAKGRGNEIITREKATLRGKKNGWIVMKIIRVEGTFVAYLGNEKIKCTSI